MLTAGVGAVLLVGVLIGPGQPRPVEAAWTDVAAASAPISAAVLPVPNFTTCRVNFNVLLGVNSLDLEWSSTQSGGQLVEYTRNGTTTQGTTAISQESLGNGVYKYKTNVRAANLLGLLGLSNLLGSTSTVQIYSTAGTAWRSAPATRKLVINLLGLGYSCTVI